MNGEEDEILENSDNESAFDNFTNTDDGTAQTTHIKAGSSEEGED